jgi:hypothetical protein
MLLQPINLHLKNAFDTDNYIFIICRNLIFGHKLHIGTPYRGKHFWTHHIPTSCLPTLLILTILPKHCMSHIENRKNKMNSALMLAYDTPALRQTGSRNLTGQKTLPTIWSLWPNIRFLPSIVAEKIATKSLPKSRGIISEH